MLIFKVILIVFAVLFFNTSSSASPTSNEFAQCQKKAVAILEYCLKDSGDNCWSQSKAGYESCRKDVIQSHNVDRDRRAMEEKRIKEKSRKADD